MEEEKKQTDLKSINEQIKLLSKIEKNVGLRGISFKTESPELPSTEDAIGFVLEATQTAIAFATT